MSCHHISARVFPDSEKQSTDHHRVENPSYLLKEINFQRKESTIGNIEECIGALEVHVHQVRDIRNICIYQKQDINAKLCLTSDPKMEVSMKTIEKAGHIAVFDEKFLLNVGNIDYSLKCEIRMLSRVRIIRLMLEHNRGSFQFPHHHPRVWRLTQPCRKKSIKSLSNELGSIGFPDPKVANENYQMVEEYNEICTEVESHYWDGLVTADNENQVSTEVGSKPSRIESPPSSVSTTETSFASVPVSFASFETPKDSTSSVEEHVSPLKGNSKEKTADGLEAGDNVVSGSVKPLVSVSIEPEPQVVQQDIVDMYMKIL
ncbi:hypothetical protein OROMI_012828 [Orobanche minor]